MTDYTIVDKFESSIATMTPSVRQHRWTLALAAVVLLATGIIAPFGAIQLGRIDGFIPATESVIVITDLFTEYQSEAASFDELKPPLRLVRSATY